jgi:hypothetical protein
MRVYPREIDTTGYQPTLGVAKNGSRYATLRHESLATMTAFGAAAEALVEASERGGLVRVDSYERSGTIKIVTIACPVTGLPIGENGRMEPVPVAPQYEALPEPEPEGFWDRLVDGLRDLVGLEDDRPEPLPVEIAPGRTGYPVVDRMIDDIRHALVENPNLIDANGGRFDLMAEKHLPRLATRHAETVRNATPEDTRLADAMFSEGMGVTRDSFDVALREHRSMKMDALAIEMNFLRSKQGLQATFDPVLRIDAQPRGLLLQAVEQDRRALPAPTSSDRWHSLQRDREDHAPASEPVASTRGIVKKPLVLKKEAIPRPRRATLDLPSPADVRKAVSKRVQDTGARGPKSMDDGEAVQALQRAANRREFQRSA